MKLRIRCPSCRTVLNVPLGAVPTCPTCGFGGVSDPPQEHTAPAGDPQDPWAQPQGEWPPPAAGDAPPGWLPPPAGSESGGGEGWPPEGGEWAETPQTPEGWGEPEAPKKRGLFRRKK